MIHPGAKLLRRQVQRATSPQGSLDLKALLDSVRETYGEHEATLRRIDRANKLMAEELEEMLEIREAAARERAARLEEMERAQTALAASEARARHLAYHDTLTGLLNRAMLTEHLNAAWHQFEPGSTLAVYCIDLDRFKGVNDTFGHQAGDELIRVAANLLSELAPSSCSIARIGGDEFAILHPATTPARASALADRIVRTLAKPIELEVGQIYVGASVGVTMVDDPIIDPLEALRQADLALYHAKQLGRSQYSFYTREMDAAVRTRRDLQTELKAALANGDIELFYQPQIDGAGRISGVEALARWQHPMRGTISPSVFIPVAEECGLIVELGLHVLRRAFLDGARWPDLNIAVNISTYQLRMKDFVPRVSALLWQTGAKAEQFELELTESALLGDDASTHETLQQLRGMGFRMALDDFGTGYSSLSYLRRYPIDKIKIDRSFVASLGKDQEALAVVRAIVSLARSLRLNVIAEGVESDIQRIALRAAGCDAIQGFLSGKPMSGAELDGMLARNQADDDVAPTPVRAARGS